MIDDGMTCLRIISKYNWNFWGGISNYYSSKGTDEGEADCEVCVREGGIA